MKFSYAPEAAEKHSAASIFFVFALIFFPSQARTQTANHADRPPATKQNLSSQISADAHALFESLNHERSSRGLPVLHWDAHLAAAAQLHAQRMADANTLLHQLPGEPALLDRFAASGAKFSSIAENIAEGSDAALIHDGWMHSPGHRANILDPQNTAVGIAVVRGTKQLFAVQDFARAVETLDLDQQEKKVSALLAAHGLKVEAKSAEARKNCDANSGISGVTAMSLLRFDASDLTVLPDGVEKKIESRSFQKAAVGACSTDSASGFSHYRLVILLY